MCVFASLCLPLDRFVSLLCLSPSSLSLRIFSVSPHLLCPSPRCVCKFGEPTLTPLCPVQDMTGGARGKGLFPDNMMHLGGDEVNTHCWEESSEISKWMKDHNLTPDQTYAYFVNRTQVRQFACLLGCLFPSPSFSLALLTDPHFSPFSFVHPFPSSLSLSFG